MFLGQRIRAARQEAKLSPVELATELGITQPTLWRYEAGKVTPKLSRLTDIAARVGKSLEYFIVHRPKRVAVRASAASRPKKTKRRVAKRTSTAGAAARDSAAQKGSGSWQTKVTVQGKVRARSRGSLRRSATGKPTAI
jgi:transcriptional regulator with XRE-family HTH domain